MISTVLRSSAAALLAAGAAATLAVQPAAAAPAASPPGRAASSAPGNAAGPRIAAEVRGVMSRMTLAGKIGQLFVTYVYGPSATTGTPADVQANQALYGVSNGAQLIAKYHVGGIIYFTWSGNLDNPAQIAGLSNGLQQAAMSQPVPVPLEISTDQEGGIVNRIGAPAAISPGNMAIGATFSPGMARQAAAVTGQQLRAMGINVDNAPVVDVNTNPANTTDGTRSFGDDPDAVATFAAASVSGFQHAGISAVAKHFPGLGDTTVNTDLGVAVSNETRQQIFTRDIPPFRAAIQRGAGMVMAGHVIVPALDPSNRPASLSEPIVTGILRRQLGFSGVVITDSLSAGALAGIPADQVILDAIQAGDDQLLMPEDLASAEQTVMTAVQQGTISEQRLDASVARILTMKFRLGLFTNPYTTQDAVQRDVGNPAQLATMARVARRSITLVKNAGGLLPLRPGSGEHVLVTGWGYTSTATLAAGLASHGVSTTRVWTGSAPDPAAIQSAVAAARQSDVVVVTTEDAWGDTGQQQLVKALQGTGKPVIVVALDTPYDAAYTTEAPAFLAAYGFQPDTLTAVANALFGANPLGRLPVTVRNPASGTVLYPRGWGLHYSSGR
jgi:beta-N-acetylhexosaminidase